MFKVEPTFTPPTKRLVKDPVAPVSTPEQLRFVRVLVPALSVPAHAKLLSDVFPLTPNVL